MDSRVFVVRRDNRLVSFDDVDGGWRENPATDAEGLWPAPRPGTTAAVASRAIGAAKLVLTDSLAEVPGAETEPPLLLGPRLPHYSLWSPDGSKLCYVIPDGRSLVLKTWDVNGPEAVTHLSAAPLFAAWHPDGDWLAVHHGSSLTAYNTATGEQRSLSDSAMGFRTPAFRPGDGALVWAEVQGDGVDLRLGAVDGTARTLATFPGGMALGFRPGTTELTAAVAIAPEGGVFSEIVVVDTAAESPRPRRLVAGPVVAYWWAPNGEKFVALHPSYTGDGRFQPRAYAHDGRFLGAIEPMIPSGDSATMVGFFDQYAISHPCWSADSRWFGMAGRFVTEGPARSFTSLGGDSAWVWAAESGKAPVAVAEGQFMAFSRP